MMENSHQFSQHFAKDTDNDFKNEEFEKTLSKHIVGFIQCYPHLIEKKIENGVEKWVFRFKV